MEFTLQTVCLLLVVIGALNWGTIALFNADLVKVVGNESIEKIVKLAVGVASLVIAFALFGDEVQFVKKAAVSGAAAIAGFY
jgi:uncharacterized membrane protein YuzA (DUF378 family)